MAFTLRILFDGLCIPVPNTDERKGMRILMIDARAPGVASNGENQVSHVPSVRFALADLSPDHKQPAHRIEYSSQEAVPRGQWYLNGDDLEIRANGRGLPDAPLTVLRGQSEARDFSFIPTMRTIYPERGGLDVRDECLDNNLKRLADAGLVARLRLQAGVVGAFAGGGGRYISSDEYMFTGEPTRHRQRMASRWFFETTIEAGEVELHSRQRGQGPVFRPRDGGLVEITIENQPPIDLMPSKPSDPDRDYDFELVYLIAKDPPLPLRIPILATAAWSELRAQDEAAAAGGGASTLSGAYDPVICPMVVYNPNGGCGLAAPPEAEASGSSPKCPPGEYNPSAEANFHERPICPMVEYNPSTEAAPMSRPICPMVEYNPSGEATLNGPVICPMVIFNPSTEAMPMSRPICPMVIFNPSRAA